MVREGLVKVPATILGARMRNKRKALRLSQHDLGGGDFSPSYVSAVERGKIRPSLKALYILADRLGEPPTYFLQDEDALRATETIQGAIAAATVAMHRGEPGKAVETLRSVSVADARPQLQARWHLCLGKVLLAQHKASEAIAEFQSALSLAEQIGDAALLADARLYAGDAFYQEQKVGIAAEYHHRSLEAVMSGAIKDPEQILHTYVSLITDLLRMGQHGEAMALSKKAMHFADAASSLRSLAFSFWDASDAARAANDPQAAARFAQMSLGALDNLRVMSLAVQMHSVHAALLSETGGGEAAQRAWLQARDLAQRTGDSAAVAAANVGLGQLHCQHKEYGKAESLVLQAIQQASELGDLLVEGRGLLSLAQICDAQARRQDAERNFLAAVDKLQQAGARELLNQAYFQFGQALVSWGETTRGSEYLAKAYLEKGR